MFITRKNKTNSVSFILKLTETLINKRGKTHCSKPFNLMDIAGLELNLPRPKGLTFPQTHA